MTYFSDLPIRTSVTRSASQSFQGGVLSNAVLPGILWLVEASTALMRLVQPREEGGAEQTYSEPPAGEQSLFQRVRSGRLFPAQRWDIARNTWSFKPQKTAVRSRLTLVPQHRLALAPPQRARMSVPAGRWWSGCALCWCGSSSLSCAGKLTAPSPQTSAVTRGSLVFTTTRRPARCPFAGVVSRCHRCSATRVLVSSKLTLLAARRRF